MGASVAGARGVLAEPDPRHDVAHARRRLRPDRWIGGLVLALLVAQIGVFLVTNSRFEWNVVADYLFDPLVLDGLVTTLWLAVIAMVLGSVLGTLVGVARLSEFRAARIAATVYVSVFRAIPPLVQLLFWFNLAYLVDEIKLGLPFGGPALAAWSTNDVISPVTAAILGLALVESAFMAEIVRAGIMSVDPGQRDAAQAMGYTGRQTFFRIVLPQAMRMIIPPSGSQFIQVLKGTSLVSVIAMADLLYSVQSIYTRTYQIVPLLLVACIWYLVVVTVFTLGQQRLERRFARGDAAPLVGRRRFGRARQATG
jgi:polar amino acid transport system permease protein